MQDNSLIFLFHIPKTGGTSLRQALSDSLGLNRGFIHLGPYGDRILTKEKLQPLEKRSTRELAEIQILSGHYLSTDFEKYFRNSPIRRAVLLRDPAERFMSHYNHAIRNRIKLGEPPVDFFEWYEKMTKPEFGWRSLYGKKLSLEDKRFAITSVGDNYMSKFLLEAFAIHGYQSMDDQTLYKHACDILDTFWHIGSIEKLAVSINILEQAIGKKLDVGMHNKAGAKLKKHVEMNDALHSYLADRNKVDYQIYSKYCI